MSEGNTIDKDRSMSETATPEIRRLADKIEKTGRATSAEVTRILKSGYETEYVMPDANIIIGHCPKGWYAMDGNDPDFAVFETVEKCLAHPIHGKSVAERLEAR